MLHGGIKVDTVPFLKGDTFVIQPDFGGSLQDVEKFLSFVTVGRIFGDSVVQGKDERLHLLALLPERE